MAKEEIKAEVKVLIAQVKQNPNARSSGEDVTKESHRTGTQKYGGHKSGPRR